MCEIEHCTGKPVGRGLCRFHYNQAYWGGTLNSFDGPRINHTSPEKVKRRLLGLCESIPSGCWEWTGNLTSYGYGRMWFGDKYKLAHRVSYELFHGPITDGMQICHRCDNPACINPKHLFMGTAKQNSNDRDAKGRSNHGTTHHKAKLKEDDVRAIRSSQKSQMGLSREYGVKQSTIWNIINRNIWKHVD